MNSIALIEFSSMAEGLGFTHHLLKNANVTLYKQEITCPGKYVLLLKGSPQALSYVAEYTESAQTLIRKRVLFKLHPQVIAGMNRTVDYEVGGSYIVIETKCFVDSIALGDDLLKKTSLKLERIVDRLGLFGKGLLICSGPSAALQLARCIAEADDYKDQIVSVELLESVTHNVFTF